MLFSTCASISNSPFALVTSAQAISLTRVYAKCLYMAQKLNLALKLWPFWNAGTLALYRFAIWTQKVARDLIPGRNVSGIFFSHINARLFMQVWLPGQLSKPFSRPKSFNTSNSQLNFQACS